MLFYNLIRLLLPDQCLLCHRTLTKGEKSLCLVCQAKLPRIRGEKSDNEAEHRMFGRVDFVHGTSFCYYRKQSDFSRLIISAKYKDMPWVNYNLARMFAETQGLEFPLIADTETTVLQELGCWGEKVACGRRTIGILRTTYLVNEEGVIEKIFTPKEIKTKIHAEQILDYIK